MSEPPRRRSLAPAFPIVLALLVPAVARASLPPLPLPEWAAVKLLLKDPPEIGQRFTLKAVWGVRVPVKVPVGFSLQLPDEIKSVGDPVAGTDSLEPGKDREVEFALVVTRPCLGRVLTLTLAGDPPRAALKAEVQRLHPEGSPEREAGLRLVDGLPAKQSLLAMVTLSVTPEESWTQEEGPIFSKYVPGPRDTLLAVYEPMPGMDPKALDEKIQELTQKQSLLGNLPPPASPSPGKDRESDPVTEAQSRVRDELFNTSLQAAVNDLARGRGQEARRRLELLDPVRGEGRVGLAVAVEVAKGVAALQLEEAKTAQESFQEALRMASRDPVARYVHYNIAEVHRFLGQFNEAHASYRKALGVKPNLWIARRRQSL